MRPDFEKAQNLATELLLKQEIDSLLIDVRKFHFDKNIHIDTLQNYCSITGKKVNDFICDEISGCCVVTVRNSINIILYDDSQPCEERKHWGIAHEVAHIYMEHNNDDDVSEVEANFFVAQTVAPEIVLYEIQRRCQRIDADCLVRNFNISYQAACKRINTMMNRGCYNSGAIDYLLLDKMLPFLDYLNFPFSSPEQVYDNPDELSKDAMITWAGILL